MNIVINYDFIKAIKDANDGFTLQKIVRNNKNIWLSINLPLISLMEYLINKDEVMKYLPRDLLLNMLICLEIDLFTYLINGDRYKKRADNRLDYLTSMLEELNIKTSPNLLKKSVCYHTINNLKINENRLPQIIESKYILVPCYDYKNDIKETSLVQEHTVGSKKYILSIGSINKVLNKSYSTI